MKNSHKKPEQNYFCSGFLVIMRIIPISNNFNKPSKVPNFRSMSCDYMLNGKMEMGLYTWMFRNDLPWSRLTNFELEHFKDKEKVNIIQFAPSDGSEAFTKIISLLEASSAQAEKFFPIQAYDINKDVVDGANLGFINLKYADVDNMVKRGINPDKYFEDTMSFYQNNSSFRTVPKSDPGFAVPFRVTKTLKDKVKFREGDMFKLVENINDESNTILMSRNSLAYYDNSKIKDFVNKVSQVLKTNSLFLVGRLEEEEVWLTSYLERSGFERIMRNVFKRL